MHKVPNPGDRIPVGDHHDVDYTEKIVTEFTISE